MHIDHFEQDFTVRSLQKSKSYYGQGRVVKLKNLASMDSWDAIVRGSYGNYYNVSLHISPKGLIKEYDCSCPYDWGGPCKHIGAVLFELRNKIDFSNADQNQPERTVEELASSYLKFDTTEQRLLKIFALAYEPVTRSKARDIFNRATFKHNGKNLYPNPLGELLDKLLKEDYLISGYGGNLICRRDFADYLCDRYYQTDPDFKEAAAAIRNILPFNLEYYKFADEDRIFREMRIARYDGKYHLFIKYFNQFSLSGSRDEDLVTYWLGETFDKERLKTFAPGILGFLISEYIIWQLYTLEPVDEYYELAFQIVDDVPDPVRQILAMNLAQLSMMRGDWDRVEFLTQYFEAYEQILFSGIYELLEGNTQEALGQFEEAQRLYRKTMQKKKIVLPELGGIFHLLAYLNTRDVKYYGRINIHLKEAQRQMDAFDDVYQWIEAVMSFLNNDKSEAERVLSDYETSPVLELFKYLCQFWVSEKLLDLEEISMKCRENHVQGYEWVASQMNAILEELGKGISDIPLPTGMPLIRILPRIEEWETALKVLGELGGKAGLNKNESEHRLVWLVDFEKGLVQAKHQKRSQKGWTKGRSIASSRLSKGHVEGMTQQDQLIVKGMYYGWSGYSNINYTRDSWKHFVDHPLLFLHKSPATAVQLVKSKPVLIAKPTGKGYSLKLTPEFTGPGSQVIKESPTRYLYLEISERLAQIANALNGKSLFIPEKGVETLREVLSGLSDILQVQSDMEDDNLPVVEANPRPCMHLLPVGDGFHVEIYVKPFGDVPPYVVPGSGESYVISFIKGIKTATNRDLKTEKLKFEELCRQVPVLKNNRPTAGVWQLEDTQTCLQLLLQIQPLLNSGAILLEWPKGEKLRIDSVGGFDNFRMQVTEKGSWFEVRGELRLDEQKVLNMQDLLLLSERQNQFVEVSPGKFFALTEEFRQRLRGINGLLSAQKKKGVLQLHPLAISAIEPFTQQVRDFNPGEKFQESRERLEKAFSRSFRVPKKFKAVLRPYQKEGFQWLHRCADGGVGACLADDMGLGKTIQALALLTDRASLGPALVVAPASVCRNWRAETKRFAPLLNPVLFGEGDRSKTIKSAKKGDMIIVTYDLMTREEELFTQKSFATIVLDEAQAIKNRTTRRSETAMNLQGDYKMIMTGTPLENHLGELWNLFQFLNPGLLGSIESFNERFAVPIEKYKDENKRDQLRRLVQPFILRRRKDEVLKDLPAKTEITLTVELSPEERAFYEALRRNAIEKLTATEEDGQAGQQHLRILAELMRLRRAACHPTLADPNAKFPSSSKFELFGEVLDELLENKHKALVFSQFVGHLKILEKALNEKGVNYQYLDGSTPLKVRQERIEAFQSGDGDVFLISLKAGGVGLNLTAADYVIHTDPWWNPAVEDQATDRVHRIGQERPVTVYRLVAENTIEEKILELHAKKRDLADSLLAGTDVSAKMTAKQLMALLKEG